MATTIGATLFPFEASTPSWAAPWGYLGPTPIPKINLQTATPDGCRAVILAFDRIPVGSGMYVINSSDGGSIPTILSVAIEAPYSHLMRMTFATGGTAGKTYTVDVLGLEGPSGETLGTSSATWTAPTPAAVTVSSADAESASAILVTVAQDLADDAALHDPATYTITPTGDGDAFTVSGAALAPGTARTVRVFVTGGTPGASYTVTVGTGTLVSLDGGTVRSGSRSATFLAFLGMTGPWIPPGVVLTLEGSPLDGTTLALLPEDGEPGGAVLVRAAWLSLRGKRQAEPDDVLPDPWRDPPDRGGWWGDSLADNTGDRWGSRLWLLYRARGDDIPARAEEYVREALGWMVEDGIASAVDCHATASGKRLDLDVTIARPAPGGQTARLRFDLWAAL